MWKLYLLFSRADGAELEVLLAALRIIFVAEKLQIC
jgi:hypothetical protein